MTSAVGAKPAWRSWVLDWLAVFLISAALIAPLFKLNYSNYWGSIESIFISDARHLRDHGYTAKWQPDWYCGTRWDYIYPPALRYGTALIAFNPKTSLARAYHLYIAFFYCFGIAGVYLLIRAATGSRGWAFTGAIATALLSPSYLFLRDIYRDARLAGLPPQRLNALARYGEGPHITALGWIVYALACSWQGLRRGRMGWLILAAICCAMVTSNNFYGTTALAMWFPFLAWAIWLEERDHWVWVRAAAIAVLGYGLTASWLVPSYFQLTLFNLRHVSAPSTAWSRWAAFGLFAAFAVWSWFWAKGKPGRTWTVFVAGGTAFFTLSVLGNQFYNFRILGEPLRLVPELDLSIILLLLIGLRRLWQIPRVPRWAFLVLALGVLVLSRHYLRGGWGIFVEDNEKNRIEYKLTKWIHENLPGERVLASGSLRFWYNAWYDGPMLGGGSEQGLLNQYTIPAQWHIFMGNDAQFSIQWLQAMGASAVVVHDKNSQERYKDFEFAGKFKGILEVLHDSGQGDVIYRVPRRFPARARVVDRARLDAAPPMPRDGDGDVMNVHIDVLEKGPDARPELIRESRDRMRLKARTGPGQSLVVQETFDPYWRAYESGRPLEIRQTILQFMRIDAPPGEHDIEFRFETPLENQVGRGVTLATLAAMTFLLWRSRRRAA
jgi:hypothetical protein